MCIIGGHVSIIVCKWILLKFIEGISSHDHIVFGLRILGNILKPTLDTNIGSRQHFTHGYYIYGSRAVVLRHIINFTSTLLGNSQII